MTIKETIDILTTFNRWRRGEGEFEWSSIPSENKDLPYSGTTIGKAIDGAIVALKRITPDDTPEEEIKEFDWKEKRVNNLDSNPIEGWWCVAKVGDTVRLYVIKPQQPQDESGLVTSEEPEGYVLFEGLCATRRNYDENPMSSYDGWMAPRLSFVHMYKTLDSAKQRAATQAGHINDIIKRYFPDN